ncbi:MAG: FHA domain-containing protein [Gemmataceae bacterium]|nr:FHA domain-containing protein [Gemmataceae bacterium]MCI0740952.1 FHA domain-containing protein [Gemmataceae bacterium]
MLTDPAAAFLRACGAGKPIHLAVERGFTAQELVLQQPFAVLGNSPKADVLLEDSSVSARHVYLQVFGGQLFFFVTDRIRGALHQGQRLAYGWFARGDSLEVGTYRVTLLDDGATPLSDAGGSDGSGSSNPLSSGSTAHLAVPFVTFDFGQESRIESHWHMRRQLALVGRSSLCKVRIHTRTISRVHCSLVLTHEGPWVVDLLGKGGIKVDGQPIRFAKINNGAVLEVGNYRTWCRYPVDGNSRSELPTQPAGRQLATLPPSTRPLAPLPASPGALQTDTLQSLLLPLISQFNQMQNQMYDQFQQSMLRMFQLFSALHKDQLQVLREELDRVHELTRELQTLQQQLALENKQQDASPPWPQWAAMLSATVPLPDGSDQIPQPNGSPVSFSRDPQGSSDSIRRAELNQLTSAEPDTQARVTQTSAQSALPKNGKAQGAVPLKKESSFLAPNPAPAAAAGGTGADLHNLLSQRVNELQQERQGRWQRLMESLFGRSGGEVP